jgi:iron complex transport system ATP-binding protein
MTLSAHGLSIRRGGRTLLDALDLTLIPGQVTAVLGPNGAGKSTLLSSLAGLIPPDAGRVMLDTTDLSRLPLAQRARRIAVLPQTPELAWPVEVRTLVGLGRIPHHGARGADAADDRAIDAAMTRADVTAFADRPVTTLSGGERARALIARALATEPHWLLADEPLTGLDPAHQLTAADLFRSLAGEGMGVVVTLHNLTLALRLADRVVILQDGRVAADGPPDQALSPDTIARVYGVRATRLQTADGPVLAVAPLS